jgi:uncharacterized protein with ParB-like and HNH nuclease domain
VPFSYFKYSLSLSKKERAMENNSNKWDERFFKLDDDWKKQFEVNEENVQAMTKKLMPLVELLIKTARPDPLEGFHGIHRIMRGG